VHAEDGLDELSTLGPTRVSELREGKVHTWSLDPKSLGLDYARLSDLQVNSVTESAEALRRIFEGEKGPRRDIALLNGAAALVVAGVETELADALRVAASVADGGKARQTLEALVASSNRDT
jgi:anthranilate phosphoribosyltransferase